MQPAEFRSKYLVSGRISGYSANLLSSTPYFMLIVVQTQGLASAILADLK